MLSTLASSLLAPLASSLPPIDVMRPLSASPHPRGRTLCVCTLVLWHKATNHHLCVWLICHTVAATASPTHPRSNPTCCRAWMTHLVTSTAHPCPVSGTRYQENNDRAHAHPLSNSPHAHTKVPGNTADPPRVLHASRTALWQPTVKQATANRQQQQQRPGSGGEGVACD